MQVLQRGWRISRQPHTLNPYNAGCNTRQESPGPAGSAGWFLFCQYTVARQRYQFLGKHVLTDSFKLDRLLGTLLVLLGVNTMAGWLLQVPAMVEIVRGLVPMVFNTGLGFALTGMALLVGERRAGVPRTALGWCMLLLYSLTLAEHVLDASLGVDMAWVHHWYDYGNTRPGRMAPNSALGFMLIGAVHVAAGRVDSRATARSVVVLTLCILTIGLTGLGGYLLAPDLLFGWSRSARMAVHTAVGMIAAAVGIWAGWSRSAWYAGRRFFTEAGKVRLLGTAILIVVTTTVGLAGFVLMQESLEKAIEGRLLSVVQSRGPWLATMTRDTVQHAHSELRMVAAQEAALPLLRPSTLGGRSNTFDDAARRLLVEGYAHVAVEDAQRRVVWEAGELATPAQFTAMLDKDGTELVWNGVPLLRVRAPVIDNGEVLGHLRLDKSMQAFSRVLFNVATLGESAEVSACVRQSGRIVCLPNRQQSRPFELGLAERDSHRDLPMEYALGGRTGVMYTLDYRGHNVVAAYGAIVPGMGFVARQDTIEAYAVIRRALALGVPIILLISLGGAYVLYSQTDPLVTRMHDSERRADQSAAEIRALMHAVADGIMTVDGTGRVRSANPAACALFGHAEGALAGYPVASLIDCAASKAHAESAAPQAHNDFAQLVGTANVRVDGRRSDGVRFPLELSVTAVHVGKARHLVVIMRDITERQALERRLERMAQYDSLTGLANRTLFIDRLRIALARSQRAQSSLALLFIDLDGFKQVNDTLGHHAGDQLLVAVAQRMTMLVRCTDTVARLGGDEFTVLLEDVTQSPLSASAVAEKILVQLQEPFVIDAGCVQIGASIGLVVRDGAGPVTDMEQLLQLADSRMYLAKQSGKNRVVGP
ncbi:diguanylate cyclase domain-containing protein [Pseudoduganella umbonata]|uniref:Diguanylate cyclase n=1 Tax=Pseudoduganella umbonata TaxID=864828 RepID=A0A4P8HLE7_9BURK|nr:diguanylate cyclase [Pseudoduganella umbonata]MBB3221689.1 diguanylate cyclase (GGDEF)-like protein/PAS domain S-box-containing protein [Pseudoduganella umbonata]QCP09088.1 diguanylate cyclase [Pseudoduganella umbonata]